MGHFATLTCLLKPKIRGFRSGTNYVLIEPKDNIQITSRSKSVIKVVGIVDREVYISDKQKNFHHWLAIAQNTSNDEDIIYCFPSRKIFFHPSNILASFSSGNNLKYAFRHGITYRGSGKNYNVFLNLFFKKQHGKDYETFWDRNPGFPIIGEFKILWLKVDDSLHSIFNSRGERTNSVFDIPYFEYTPTYGYSPIPVKKTNIVDEVTVTLSFDSIEPNIIQKLALWIFN